MLEPTELCHASQPITILQSTEHIALGLMVSSFNWVVPCKSFVERARNQMSKYTGGES
jgi:hypothetical protein